MWGLTLSKMVSDLALIMLSFKSFRVPRCHDGTSPQCINPSVRWCVLPFINITGTSVVGAMLCLGRHLSCSSCDRQGTLGGVDAVEPHFGCRAHAACSTCPGAALHERPHICPLAFPSLDPSQTRKCIDHVNSKPFLFLLVPSIT